MVDLTDYNSKYLHMERVRNDMVFARNLLLSFFGLMAFFALWQVLGTQLLIAIFVILGAAVAVKYAKRVLRKISTNSYIMIGAVTVIIAGTGFLGATAILKVVEYGIPGF